MKNFVVTFLVGALVVFGHISLSFGKEKWSGELTVQYPLGYELSKKDACQKASLKAKLNSMTMAGCETITQNKYRSCKSSNDQTRCEFFSETFNAFNGCFIKSFNVLSENPDAKSPENDDVCEVKAQVSVAGFDSKHDPSFLLSINEDMETIFRDGQGFLIQGKVHQPSYVYILGWYPDSDEGYYHTVFPSNSGSIKFNGEFDIPEMEAFFPKDFRKDEVNEFIIVLATKTPLNMKSRELIEEFYKRLDDYDRQNWRIVRVGYRIVR